MFPKEFQAKVVSVSKITPSVVRLVFKPDRSLPFRGGQFISLYAPSVNGKELVRRPYSLANGVSTTARDGLYELSVKIHAGGAGSQYIKNLKVGDVFRASGPYGEFTYKSPAPGRSVCFIGTGTGLAPFKSMVFSPEFKEHPPEDAMLIQGARVEADLLYPGLFEKLGIYEVHTLSRADESWTGLRGRVTDYLASLPADWPWQDVDFYICGNSEMVLDVASFLIHGRGVPRSAVFHEIFSACQTTTAPSETKTAA